MALILELTKQPLERIAHHTGVFGSYTVVIDADGQKCLQIDTYGSAKRKIKGKKSQSIRLSPKVIAQLQKLFANEFK